MVVPHSSDDEKKALRARMRAERARRPSTADEARDLVTNVIAALAAFPGEIVAGVWPLAGEPDLRPAWAAIHAQGRLVALPETTPLGTPLQFRKWTPDVSMIAGRYRTWHPDGPLVLPDIICVPLLAFDARLNRLGYGGGYYDRTLAMLSCAAIGVAFSWQEVAHVPTGAFDQPLDRIVTERRVFQREQKGADQG